MSKKPPKSNSDEPPRIKLTKGKGSGNENEDHPEIPDPENLPEPGEHAPPKIELPKMPSKEATSPVDISPTGVSRPKDETAGIDLGSAPPPPSLADQTMKIDLSDEGQVGTSRVEISAIKPASSDFDPFDSNQTMRIDLSEGMTGDSKSDTSPIHLPPVAESGSDIQAGAQTMRVDLDATADLAAAASGALTSPVRKETSKVVPPGETAQVDPSDQTMHINLQATEDLSAAASGEQTPPVSKETAKMVPPGETAQVDPSMQTMRVNLETPADLSAAATGEQTSPVRKETSKVVPPGETAPVDPSMQTMRVNLEKPADLSAAATGEQTPPVRKETSKVVPPGETAPVDPSMQTMRVDLSAPDEAVEQPPPITPADASMQTMRIDIPAGIPSKKKSKTSRLSLGATQSIKEATSELESQDDKNKSGTIRLGDEGELNDLIENQDSLTQQTIKLELEDKKAGKTSPISTTPISTSPIPPVASGSVDLGEMMSSEPAKAPKAGSPKTIRMRKPDAAPQTRVLKKSPAPEQTIRVQGADTVLEEGKTGTARIDLPGGDAGDSGDKKTIRIRRPGGAPVGTATMSISRSTPSMAKKPGAMADAPGWGYTFVAVITAILVGVTLYVLAAQLNSIPTDGQSLPWPGRIL